MVLLAVMFALFVAGKRSIEPAAIADWYAEVALRHLPHPFSAFAPGDTPTGAFYFCIRRVVKQVTETTSVETFPSHTPENTRAMGDGRYRIATYVIEDRTTGERLQRHFTCTTRYAYGRWVLEDLTLGDYTQLTSAVGPKR